MSAQNDDTTTATTVTPTDQEAEIKKVNETKSAVNQSYQTSNTTTTTTNNKTTASDEFRFKVCTN